MSRFEQVGEELRLFFKHSSGRNFVLVEPIVDGNVASARAVLVKRMKETNKGTNPMGVGK